MVLPRCTPIRTKVPKGIERHLELPHIVQNCIAECSMYTVWCMYTLRQPKRYLFAANWSMCVVPMQLSMQVTATHAACCNAYANLWSVRNWQLFRDATV